MPISLPSPQLLEIAGPDAIAFAHAQFSSDVLALPVRHWQWSTWLSPQGRVRALFHLLRSGEDRFLVLLRGGSAEALRAALSRFVMRSRVQLQVIEATALGMFEIDEVSTVLGAAPHAFELVERPPLTGFALPGGTPRWYVFANAAATLAGAPSDTLDRWRAADIAAGLVELDDGQLGQFLPDWLGLRRLDAVSMSKGCYPGQEVVARLHFKGGNKRWLRRLEFDAPALPAAGTPLALASGRPAGELLNAAWTSAPRGVALAVLAELPAGASLVTSGSGTAFRVISPIDAAND